MTGTKTTPPTRKETLEALSRYQRQGAASINAKELSAMLVQESDRGVMVFLGSVLEDLLLLQLMSRFKGLSTSERKNLTRSGGLLANFDDRINLARALGLLSQDSLEMLQVFKALRNACAHSRKPIGFNTPEVRDTMALLFEGDGADDIRTAVTDVMVLRIAFLTAFVFQSEIILGKTEEAAQKQAQKVMDSLTIEIERTQVKNK